MAFISVLHPDQAIAFATHAAPISFNNNDKVHILPWPPYNAEDGWKGREGSSGSV